MQSSRSWQAARPANRYQGGASVELIGRGHDPARTYGAKLKGAVRRTYDAETRGYAWRGRRRVDAPGAGRRVVAYVHQRYWGCTCYVALQVKRPPSSQSVRVELSTVDHTVDDDDYYHQASGRSRPRRYTPSCPGR